MAEYDVVPKRLSIQGVTGKALVLSDISCKTTVFPPRRIFDMLNDIQFGQLNPSISGVSIGGRVTTVTPVGGNGPFVITIDPNDDDDDDEDYVVVDDDITWDVTPDNDCRTITVRATDANGDYTTKTITICGKTTVYWSDDFTGSSLNSRWDTEIDNSTTKSFSGHAIEISVAPTNSYSILQTNHAVADGTPWKVEVVYESISLTASSNRFDFGIRATIGGTDYQAVLHEDNGTNARGFWALKGSAYSSLSPSSGDTHSSMTLSVEYNGVDTITCRGGGSSKTYAATGSMTNARIHIDNSVSGDTISGNIVNFAFTHDGAPYKT